MTYVLGSYVCMENILSMYEKYTFYVCLLSFKYSNRTDERLPDIMWCRDPFMEVLKEIEDIN